MADQKISELTALTGANVADDDAIAIVDTSATETKKIVFSELKNALDTATGFVRITGDTMTGALTTTGLTVGGDISLTGATTISNTSGDLTLDVAGDLILDSDSPNWRFKDNGTSILEIGADSQNPVIYAAVADKDIQFKGNDNGSTITALTLDMSQAGEADFNSAVKVSGGIVAHQTNKGVLEYNNNIFMLRAYGANAGDGSLQFKTGGGGGSTDSLAMTIDDSQNVGIGTSSPSSQLHLAVASGAGSPTINLERTDTSVSSTNTIGNIIFTAGEDGSEETVAQISAVAEENFSSTSSATGLFFKTTAAGSTSSTEAMRIDSSGRVGIGTSDPSSNTSTYYDDLVIKNDTSGSGAGITLQSNTSNGFGGVDFRKADGSEVAKIYASSGGGQLGFETVGTERMRIDSNGRVAIGGSGTSGNNLTLHNASAVEIDLDCSGGKNFRISSESDSALKFTDKDANAERMRIDSSGHVGIGRSNPLHPLHIGDTSGNTVLELQRTNTNTSGSVGAISFTASDDHSVAAIHASGDGDNEGAHLIFRTTSAASENNYFNSTSERMRITSAGNLIVGGTTDGASSSITLQNDGDIRGVLASGAGGDSLISAISGVSNGYQITVDSSNNQTYKWYNGGTQSMTLDASGNLLVGTTNTSLYNNASDDYGFVISSSGTYQQSANNTVLAYYNRQNGDGEIMQFRKDGAAVGSIGSNTTSGQSLLDLTATQNFRLLTNGSERMRLDASGNLLVGKTAAGIANAGSEFSSTGRAFFTFDNGGPLQLNRLNGDGDIIELHKDGAEVGSIGSYGSGSGMYLGTGDTGIAFNSTDDNVFPRNPSTNLPRDNAIDLGSSTARFKDLYLSGGVDFGGAVNSGGVVSSSNKLDDYEEGTWTPTAAQGITGLGVQSATYTKVGRIVTVMTYLSAMSGKDANALHIGGLPFTPASNNYSTGVVECSTSGQMGVCRTNSNNTYLVFYKPASDNTRTDLVGNDVGSSHIIFSITYQTT